MALAPLGHSPERSPPTGRPHPRTTPRTDPGPDTPSGALGPWFLGSPADPPPDPPRPPKNKSDLESGPIKPAKIYIV